MTAKPTNEHHWLDRMAGEWDMVHRCSMGPDQPAVEARGRISGRSLGGLWMLLDCQGTGPEGESWSSMFTLGYDPAKKRFLGTFVASMMTHLWVYDGILDPESGRLILDVEGPGFDGKGIAQYRDIFEYVDDSHWILRSEMLGDNGQWKAFLEGHHHRIGG